MKNQTRNPFNVPIDGFEETYLSMDELLCAFRSLKASDPEMARKTAEYACESGSIRAKFEYCNFLRTTPELDMPQAERYNKAEYLLKELLNLLDVPDRFIVAVAMELGTLYADCLARPVGALAMYLHAKRHGATVEDRILQNLHKKMEKMDINQLGNNSEDCLLLGQELQQLKRLPRLTELFLREAVEKSAEEMKNGSQSATILHGRACLALGDYYDAHTHACSAYRLERDKMYAQAKKSGFPEYVSIGGDKSRKDDSMAHTIQPIAWPF